MSARRHPSLGSAGFLPARSRRYQELFTDEFGQSGRCAVDEVRSAHRHSFLHRVQQCSTHLGRIADALVLRGMSDVFGRLDVRTDIGRSSAAPLPKAMSELGHSRRRSSL
jgi:hypothetical protein